MRTVFCSARAARGFLLLNTLTLLWIAMATSAAPIHRYSFSGNANDSIGTAHGTLAGNAIIADGNLVLNGTNGGMQFPSGLFAATGSLSLEAWFLNTKNSSGLHLWTITGTPAVSFQLLGGSPRPDARIYYGGQAINTMLNTSPLPLNRWLHVVWTQNQSSKLARIYVNGQLLAQNTNFAASPGTTTGGMLGGLNVNSPIAGYISEFRVHSNALSHVEVLRSWAAGPDQLPGELALTNLSLRLPAQVALGSLTQPMVWGDFDGQSKVELTGGPEITFTSSAPGVIEPLTNGYLRALALGSAEIVASYGGLSSTNTVNVLAANQFDLAHRYKFERWDNATNVLDFAGSAHGRVLGAFPSTSGFTNGGQLYLNGTSGHVDLPDGILSSLDEVTVETWVTRFSEGTSWTRVMDFGSQWGGGGRNYFFLTAAVQSDHSTSAQQFLHFTIATNAIIGEKPRLIAQPWLIPGVETHLAVTYAPSRQEAKLYTNGVLAAAGVASIPLSAITDTNNWLGRSQFSSDSFYNGLFNEFRLYRRALTEGEIRGSFAMGTERIGADYVLQARVAGSNLILSWGPSASWCRVQSADSLATPAVWSQLPVSPVFTNGRCEVTLSLSGQPSYFRLAPPE